MGKRMRSENDFDHLLLDSLLPVSTVIEKRTTRIAIETRKEQEGE